MFFIKQKTAYEVRMSDWSSDVCSSDLQVGMRLGAITSAADTIEVVLDSPGGHASRPHLTTDLIYALGTVVTGLPGMLSRRIDPRTGTVMVWEIGRAAWRERVCPSA